MGINDFCGGGMDERSVILIGGHISSGVEYVSDVMDTDGEESLIGGLIPPRFAIGGW